MEGRGLAADQSRGTAATAKSKESGRRAPAAAARSAQAFRLAKSDKVSARVLENFTRLLSSLLAAGVPLSRALVILHKEAANPGRRARSGKKSTTR